VALGLPDGSGVPVVVSGCARHGGRAAAGSAFRRNQDYPGNWHVEGQPAGSQTLGLGSPRGRTAGGRRIRGNAIPSEWRTSQCCRNQARAQWKRRRVREVSRRVPGMPKGVPPKPRAGMSHALGFGVALGWLRGGCGVALRCLCTPKSMPSLCLVYGFVVALR
jgi:hypothetical protein